MRPSSRAFAVIVGVTTLALSVAAAAYAFNLRPTAADEFAQLWHAKMLARGWLALPADPNAEFFAIDNVVDTGRWYSQYPIGGPAVLALGALLGVPWLVNPLLAGGTSVAMYQFARRAFGEVEGRAIAALFSVTPMVLLMSGSHMNHVPVLFLMSVCLASLSRMELGAPEFRPSVHAVVVGLSLGAMATIRPLDAAVAAIVVGAFQVWLVKERRLSMRDLLIQGVAGTVAVLPLLFGNRATTGDALQFGYSELYGAAHQLGFHLDPTGALHTPARALEYAALYVSELNLWATMWPVPVLVAAIATLLMLRRVTRWDALLLGLFWVQVVAYALYWHRGHFIGPRFLYTALPAIVVLVARLPFVAGDRLGAPARRFALGAVLLCIVGSWAVPVGNQGALGTATDVRNSRRIVKVDIASAASDANVHNAVVFVREPFSYRLSHRLWGLGVSRSNAAKLIARGDACGLLTAIIVAESDTLMPRAARAEAIASMTEPYVPGPAVVQSADPLLHFNSAESFTPACRAEIAGDRDHGVASYGPALLLNEFGKDGRLGGDIIYASDLGSRNEVLRKRFGDRAWYRLSVLRPSDASHTVVIKPYDSR